MKNPFKVISQKLNTQELYITERIKFCECKIKIKKEKILKHEDIFCLYDLFPKRDYVKITVSEFEDEEDSLFIENISKTEYEKKISFADDTIYIFIKIVKQNENVFSIYDLNKFYEYFSGLQFYEKIVSLKEIFGKNKKIFFDIFDEDKSMYLVGNSIAFCNYEKRNVNLKELKNTFIKVKENNFLNPEWFVLKTSKTKNPFKFTFDLFCAYFSICCIAEKVNFKNEIFYIKFNNTGKPFTLSIDKIIIYQFLPIVIWVYDNRKIDKLILTRKIIETQFETIKNNKDIISLFQLLKTEWEIYLVEDIKIYMETREKIAKQIDDNIKKLSKLYSDIISKLKSNLTAVFTLFFSIFVSNLLTNGDLSKIFDRQISRIIEIVFLYSLFFLVWSAVESFMQIHIIVHSYDLLKLNYLKVLEKNEEFTKKHSKEKNKAIWHVSICLVFWLLSLGFLFFVFESISNHPFIEVSNLLPKFKNMINEIFINFSK